MVNSVLQSTLLFIVVICAISWAKAESNSSTLHVINQFAEKFLTKLNPNYSSKHARGYEWGYMDGYSNDLYGQGKSDYSWIIPLIIVVGFGTLLIPLMGTLMTTMVTQGTINLTAGRRRRSADKDQFLNSATNWSDVIKSVEDAINKFGSHFKRHG